MEPANSKPAGIAVPSNAKVCTFTILVTKTDDQGSSC